MAGEDDPSTASPLPRRARGRAVRIAAFVLLGLVLLVLALGAGPVADMPIRAVLRAATPVSLYWCP